MLKILLIGTGGFVGAVARYGLTWLIHSRYTGTFPWGTLAVNVLGCLLIGAGMAWLDARPDLGPEPRFLLVAGLLGAFTTFSTFGWETLELFRRGLYGQAAGSVALNVALGLGAVFAGWKLLARYS